MKKIDLKKSVFDLTREYPELIDILKELGFLGVANPVVRNTLGRKMTLPMGAQKMGIDLASIIDRLKEKGFEIEN